MDGKTKAKSDDGPVIDPKLKDKPAEPDRNSVSPSGTTRRDNETDANRGADGARKRAEEGL